MCFSIKYKLVQAQSVIWTEEEVQILQRLSKEKGRLFVEVSGFS
jgi:hypothetical protein